MKNQIRPGLCFIKEWYRNGVFAALHRCLELRYESQREIPLSRAERRAQIKMRLGGNSDP
jgi:hypothetical protein